MLVSLCRAYIKTGMTLNKTYYVTEGPDVLKRNSNSKNYFNNYLIRLMFQFNKLFCLEKFHTKVFFDWIFILIIFYYLQYPTS